MRIDKGISWNDWALPLHIFAGRPYANADDKWVTQIIMTIFCFYLAFTWGEK